MPSTCKRHRNVSKTSSLVVFTPLQRTIHTDCSIGGPHPAPPHRTAEASDRTRHPLRPPSSSLPVNSVLRRHLAIAISVKVVRHTDRRARWEVVHTSGRRHVHSCIEASTSGSTSPWASRRPRLLCFLVFLQVCVWARTGRALVPNVKRMGAFVPNVKRMASHLPFRATDLR